MMTNREAADRVVGQLIAANAVGDMDEALLVAFVTLAGVLDDVDARDTPGYAALWQQYRGFLSDVREVGSGGVDDDTVIFLESVRTPVGDAKNSKPSDVRSSDRRRGGADGSAVDAVAVGSRVGRRRTRA